MSPKISVVIPAYNEEKRLPRCLKSLQNQTYPKDQFEILVVDDRSSDGTARVSKEFGAHVVSNTADIHGPAYARSVGAAKAKGEIIAYTDADTILFPDWLEKIAAYMSDPQVVCVGGISVLEKRHRFLTPMFTAFDWFHVLNHALGKPIMPGYNMAVRKSAYDAVGGINTHIKSAEDWDLAMRLRKKFGRGSIKYARDMKAYMSTRKQETLKVFLPYARDGLLNYIYVVLLGKTKATKVFNVR